MKQLSLLLFPAFLVLASCESKKSEKTSGADTLSYEWKGDSVRSQLCVRPDSLCASASFVYPVFNSNQALNDSVLAAAVAASGYLDGDQTTPEMRKATPAMVSKDFVDGFDEFVNEQKKRFPNEPIMGGTWSSEVKVNVLKQTAQIVPLAVFSFNYSGGAHPITNVVYANYKQNGQRITLADLFKPEYAKPLSVLAEKAFRTQEGLTEKDSYKDRYFFPGDSFALNNNFSIRPDGLLFRYNPYEIKAYAEGPTELLLPYTELKSILKEDGLLGKKK